MSAKKCLNTEKTRTIFDQKCPTCGTWMDSEIKIKDDTITYSCSECGLTYTAVQ
ncbi:MAG: hypothetical protein KAH86_06170 [Methanosarcinales archaeon]|nr:hypothetical protein [Methanosarcinales archaeon]